MTNYLVFNYIKPYWWMFVLVIAFVIVIFYTSSLAEHDKQLEADYYVSSMSCDFLIKRLAYEDQLYSKHSWYDAMKKAYENRCKV